LHKTTSIEFAFILDSIAFDLVGQEDAIVEEVFGYEELGVLGSDGLEGVFTLLQLSDHLLECLLPHLRDHEVAFNVDFAWTFVVHLLDHLIHNFTLVFFMVFRILYDGAVS